MDKIIYIYTCLWFLCKIKLNVLYSPKNIIFNKLLFLYFYTYFFKQKYLKNDLILFNSNKHLDVNLNYFLFRYDSLTFSTKYLYNYFYIYYFFNQKFTELNKTKQFNKFFNKYYIFFFMCFKNFINGELLFYKNLNNNFLELTFKNLKKFNRINDSKFFKKNLFSKIHFFKLKKLNDRIKYFNKNILFYFYFLKKYKNSILLQASTDIFFKTKFRFYFSEIYLYKNLNLLCLHNLYKNNLQTISINYNFNKSFFLNMYKNIFFKNYMYNNKSLIYKKYTYFDSNLNHINLDFKKINFFYGFSLCNNVNILKKKLLQLKISHSNNKSFFNQKFILKNDIKKQQIYKLVLQLLLTWSENNFFNLQKDKYINFCSNLNLFNLFNNLSIFELGSNVDNSYLDKYLMYNNHYPLFLFKNNYFDFFNFKLKKCSKPLNLKFTQYYILGFFEYFFKKKVFLKSISNSNVDVHNLNKLHYLFNEYKFYQLRVVKGLHIIEILEIIWFAFQNKDVYLLISWLRKIMEKTHLKNHKKFLNLLKAIMIKYSHIFLESFRLKGFFFDIRGKVGVAGNSKKRHFFFRIGKINLSKKGAKLDYQQNIVNTSFGVLGATMILSY